jgi:hypothetical protein
LRKGAARITTRRPGKHENTTSVDAAKMRLLQRAEAVRAQSIPRRKRLSDTARLAIVDLIDAAAMPKVLAVAVVGLARSTTTNGEKNAAE